jgi:hypothetical protein
MAYAKDLKTTLMACINDILPESPYFQSLQQVLVAAMNFHLFPQIVLGMAA